MTKESGSNPRQIKCHICSVTIGYAYLESVWEPNDDKSWLLIHPMCLSCYQKKYIGVKTH